MDKKEIVDSLRTLHDLSKLIDSTLDVENVIRTVLEKTSSFMGKDRVLLLLLDRKEKALTVRSFLGFKEEDLPLRKFCNVRSFEHCIVKKGAVINMREVLPGEDYWRAVALMPSLDDMNFAPLEVRGEEYGLLGVAASGKVLSEVELEMFCAIASHAAVAIEDARLYNRIKLAFEHTAEALAEAINSRDPYTGGHARRVAEYSMMVADWMGLAEPEKDELKLSAILHDIGKIGIADAILRKVEALSEEEYLLMRRHPEIGSRILGHVNEMEGVISGVLHHHERFDGSGYPGGLKGEGIPLQARIIAVVDAFDALTTDRPYRKAIGEAAALEKLARNEGTQFDPRIVDALRQSLHGKGPARKV
jgi:HD-GYP domain-containing protein (c-di-GMP phosphodiesterase class II)